MLLVKEHSSSKYTPRTYYNAKSAEITLAFAMDFNTAGERLTNKASYPNYLDLPLDDPWIDNARKVWRVLHKNNYSIINIAGNGIYTLSKYGMKQSDIDTYVLNVIKQVHEYHKITKIYTGGQTGVDLAGAKVGYQLGIDTEVTLPKGYIMRFEDGKDVSCSKEFVEGLIKGS